MGEAGRLPILIPLAVGLAVFAGTLLIHALPLRATVLVVRREKRLGHVGASFWTDLSIVARAISYSLVAHLVAIGMWAGVFMLCGEFHEFPAAYYHSAVNYTTLGYGDVVMSRTWRLLGPLEAANGMLMFGLSTAMVFAVIQRLVTTRFVDMKD